MGRTEIRRVGNFRSSWMMDCTVRSFLIYLHSITSLDEGIEIIGPSFLVSGPDSDQSTKLQRFQHPSFAHEGTLHSNLPHNNFVLVCPFIPLILEISLRGTFCVGFPPRCSLLPDLTISSSHVGLPALSFFSTARVCISLVPNDYLPPFRVTKAPQYQG